MDETSGSDLLDMAVERAALQVKFDLDQKVNRRLALFLAECVEDVLAAFKDAPGVWFWPVLKNPGAVRSDKVFAHASQMIEALKQYGKGEIPIWWLKRRHGDVWNAATATGSQIGNEMTMLACQAAECVLSLPESKAVKIGAFLEKCQGIIVGCTVFAGAKEFGLQDLRSAKSLEAQRQNERLKFWMDSKVEG